jgi:hypothetical protein
MLFVVVLSIFYFCFVVIFICYFLVFLLFVYFILFSFLVYLDGVLAHIETSNNYIIIPSEWSANLKHIPFFSQFLKNFAWFLLNVNTRTHKQIIKQTNAHQITKINLTILFTLQNWCRLRNHPWDGVFRPKCLPRIYFRSPRFNFIIVCYQFSLRPFEAI